MNRNKEFIQNTIVLFMGKFATQFSTLLLLPLFTRYLPSQNFGTIDLFQTYILLFAPILTLRLDSAIFRFLADKRKNNKEISKIITNIFFILLCTIIPISVICIVLLMLLKIKYFGYVIFNLIILMVSNNMIQIFRGLGMNKDYSIVSIFTAIITLTTNYIMIVFLKVGAESILIASSIANIFSIFYITLRIKFFKLLDFKKIDKKFIKEILHYSLPMISNSFSWWIVNVSDRTIISMLLGTAYNGIYSISCKFSNVLSSIYTVFNMSWQESAVLHIKDKDKEKYFTEMINKIFILFASLSLVIVTILPFIFNVIIGSKYITSYNYIPVLLYANSWDVLGNLTGCIYISLKKSKEVANTTLIAAIINLIVHLLLIKFIGLYAACISTVISYILLALYRYYDSRKYIKYNLNMKKILIYTLFFIMSSISYFINNLFINIINLLIIFIYLIIENWYIIIYLYNLILKVLKKSGCKQ